MEESSRKSIYTRPMTLAEMMPSLGGILPNNSIHKMSVRKAGKKSVAAPHTTGKDFRPSVPLTMAQLRAEIQALKPKTPPRARAPLSTVKKKWNVSTKCEKKHISNVNAGTKNLTARKILNFQPVSRPVKCNIPRPSTRPTFLSPKRAKPEKKTMNILKHLNDKNARISGIFQIPETPAMSNSRMSTKCVENNKENLPHRITKQQQIIDKRQNAFDESFRQLIGDKKPTLDVQSNANRKSLAPRLYNENTETQTILQESRARVMSDKVKTNTQVTCTQLAPQKMSIDMDESFKHLQCEKRMDTKGQSPSNTSTSSRANSEQSFLEQENVIYNEVKNVLEAVFEDSPPVSTPFKKYRNVDEYFNESSDFENSTMAANITNYDGASALKHDGSKEEGDISSLCDLMGKAQVTYDDKSAGKYNEELLKMKNELESERKFILMSLKRNEFMLNSVIKLLSLDKIPKNTSKSLQKSKSILQRNRLQSCGPKMETQCPDQQTTCNGLVRRVSKSPSYKIPKHSPCLRKRSLFKSMPVDLDIKPVTPKFTNVAMNVYMKMKKENKFLITPVAHKTVQCDKVPTTPAITSRNLQNQLEKLYHETP